MSVPLLMLWLLPTMPTTELKWSTCGLSRSTWSSLCWALTMPSKEMPCSASVVATIKPMSSLGKKPLGTMTPSQPVASSNRSEKISVARRCRSTTSRERAYLSASHSKARSSLP